MRIDTSYIDQEGTTHVDVLSEEEGRNVAVISKGGTVIFTDADWGRDPSVRDAIDSVLSDRARFAPCAVVAEEDDGRLIALRPALGYRDACGEAYRLAHALDPFFSDIDGDLRRKGYVDTLLHGERVYIAVGI